MRAWDVATGKELRRVEIQRELYGIGFSLDRKQVVLCDGMLRIFDPATFEDVSSLGSSAMDNDFSQFVFSSDGKLLATNCDGDDLHLGPRGALIWHR